MPFMSSSGVGGWNNGFPEENFTDALEEYRRYAASRYWRSKGLFQEYGPWYAITEAAPGGSGCQAARSIRPLGSPS
jgi:hypothetical protein